MPAVSILRQQIAGGSLPSVGIVGGADAPPRLYPDISPPSLARALFLPITGLISFWLHVRLGGRNPTYRPAGRPFCVRHRLYWRRRASFIVGGFAAMILRLALGAALTPSAAPGQPDQPHRVFGGGACWMLAFLLAFILLHLAAVRPTAGDRHAVTFSGASRPFVAAVAGAENA